MQTEQYKREGVYGIQTLSPVAEQRSLTRLAARCTHADVDDGNDPLLFQLGAVGAEQENLEIWGWPRLLQSRSRGIRGHVRMERVR